MNTYGYVDGNPVNSIDVYGLSGLIIALRPIILPRPILIPRSTPYRTEPFDPALPIPDFFPDQQTPNDPNGEYCKSLQRRLQNTKDEIYSKRYPDLKSNPENLPLRKGPGEKLSETVRGHEKLLNRRLNELRKLENEYYKNCTPIACLTQ